MRKRPTPRKAAKPTAKRTLARGRGTAKKKPRQTARKRPTLAQAFAASNDPLAKRAVERIADAVGWDLLNAMSTRNVTVAEARRYLKAHEKSRIPDPAVVAHRRLRGVDDIEGMGLRSGK